MYNVNNSWFYVLGLLGNHEGKKREVAAEVRVLYTTLKFSCLCVLIHKLLTYLQIEELLLAFVDISVFVNCPKTKDSDELTKYFKVPSFPLFLLTLTLTPFISSITSFFCQVTKDDYCSGSRNITHQQHSFSRLPSPITLNM